MLPQIIIAAKPIMPNADAFLLLEDGQTSYALRHGDEISITVDTSVRYCAGWYDIATHTSYPCADRAIITQKAKDCFACRKRTDFNPSFYNTTYISKKQAEYNNQPHTVYAAYFGNGIAKAGIMSDSRGFERLYEQGALLYAIIKHCPNATVAHNLEDTLIKQGLKNSVLKSQKLTALYDHFDEQAHRQVFSKKLTDTGLDPHLAIESNLPLFTYGNASVGKIEPIDDNPISGTVAAVIGKLLVLKNGDYLYGVWLDDFIGHPLVVEPLYIPIRHAPTQVSLF